MSTPGTRRGGAANRREAQARKGAVQRAELINQLPAYSIMDEDGLEQVLGMAFRILETIGIEFRHPEAPARWQSAGAQVDGARVRIKRDLIMKLISTAPSEIRFNARNPERSITLGGARTVFSGAYGAPHVLDFDDVRKTSTREHLQNFTKLAHTAKTIQINGGVLAEPQDVDVRLRHFELVGQTILLSDKPYMGAVTSRTAAKDTIALSQLVFGEEFVDQNMVVGSLVNCNTPLVWDEAMINALEIYSRANQTVICTPFVMGGASSPVSTIGACALIIAEALSGIAYTQIIRKGAPAMFGCVAQTISMKSGAPLTGSPEPIAMNLIVGQVIRKLGLVWRASGLWTTAKTPDLQAGYESIMSTWGYMLAHANWIIHAAGIVEGGLAISYSKFVHDVEQIDIFYEAFLRPRMDDLEEVFETLVKVGPGGHFLGEAHTRKNSFYIPELSDANSYEQWRDEGRLDAHQVGLAKARRMIDEYEAPAIDEGLRQTIGDFIASRSKAITGGEFER
ncbi:trimethylamine methyltransferase family protein [Rhizobium sp. LjRoot98]|uniref:trimethylamine methyltransferase family protein n=1 Tax=Rhizobium sp. LjRoot98 TaxID=3342345 RepID=UPI003ED095B8